LNRELDKNKYIGVQSQNNNVKNEVVNANIGYSPNEIEIKKEKLKNELDDFFEENDDYEVEVEK